LDMVGDPDGDVRDPHIICPWVIKIFLENFQV
jgi:hypothetical protein